MRSFKLWSGVKLSTFSSDTRKDNSLWLIHLANKQTKKAELCGLIKYIIHDSAACKICHMQAEEGVVIMSDQDIHDMHILESRKFSLKQSRGISHLNTSCDEVIPFAVLASMQPEGSASMSWTSKQSINKTTLVASVRMGAFNFPAQISLCTVFSYHACEEACHRVLCCLLSLCVMGNWGRLSADKETF